LTDGASGNAGYAVGALLAGSAADLFGLAGAMWMVAAITAASGLIVAVRMTETLHLSRTALQGIHP
jgi:hypothetical protein